MAETALVVTGRERELATLRSSFAARPGLTALVLEGEPGSGKTTLWQAGASFAEAAGHRVLRAAPAAAEARLSFAAVGDLLDGVLDTSPLPAPQRRALEVALLLREPDGPPPDARTIGAALRTVLQSLAARSPVTLAIDDAQWLDEPSRGALEFALRRLPGAPLALLLARRDAAAPLPLGLSEAERVAVGPLGLAPLHRVLRAQLGVAFPRPVLRRIHAAAGGNPFFALELGRALQRRGTVADEDPLPLPPTLQEVVAERLHSLPQAVQRGLELLAGLFDRRLSVVHEVAPAGALDAAVAAGVLEVRGERCEFTHPLLGSAVYAAMGPERRLGVHARLARATVGDEEHALHLALGTVAPDARIADVLAAASKRALERGAPHTAGRLAEHAARLTPHDETAGHRIVAAAARYAQAGDIARCGALMDALVERTGPGPLRAQALSLLALTGPRAGEFARSARLAEQALAEVGDDLRQQAQTHLLLGIAEFHLGHLESADAHRRAGAALSERVGDERMLAVALGAVGYMAMLRGEGVTPELHRGVAIERRLSRFLGLYAPSVGLGQALACTDALDEARPILETALDEARAAGHEQACAGVLLRLADLERRAGDWPRAARLARDARELYEQIGTDQERAYSLAGGSLLDAGLGRVEQARRDALHGLAIAERLGDATSQPHFRGVLGFIELSLGDARAARDWLAPASEELLRLGVGELSIYPVVHNEIDAAVACGELERAEHLTVHLEALAARSGRSWTRAMAARGRALLHAAGGDLDAAREAMAPALEVVQPFERARALLALGRIERRAKRKRVAREALEAAADGFARLPAPLWEAMAHAELTRVGVRGQSGELTETEARIAALAASGLSNPEIAATVFVSRKTVEANLSKVYRKLRVRSRVELAARFASR